MTEETPEILVAAARAAAANAYAPYSKFRVGAVVVDHEGNQFVGVNVENAAFGSTVCAEVAAIVAAATAGVREIHSIAVACLDGTDCYPCGNCRQLLREFEAERVIVQAPDGTVRTHALEDLLPNSFGPESLESGA
jgi:cytidine deaminase